MELEIDELAPGVRVPAELVPHIDPKALSFVGIGRELALARVAERHGLGLRDWGPLEHVQQRASAVFGRVAVMYQWLDHPCSALDGDIPAELLKTDEGLQRVEDALDRIAVAIDRPLSDFGWLRDEDARIKRWPISLTSVA